MRHGTRSAPERCAGSEEAPERENREASGILASSGGNRETGGVANSKCRTPERQRLKLEGKKGETQKEVRSERLRDDPGDGSASRWQAIVETGGWHRVVFVPCERKGTGEQVWRPIPPPESGIQPLAHGVSERVGRLRLLGNAINPQLAALFILAAMEYRHG